jgi:two-component system, response regulator, stage 0 sporulation protein F
VSGGGSPDRASRRKPRVLVAEDDDEMRRVLVQALERRGYEVEQARDGAAALRRLGALVGGGQPDVRPDVIVADVRMPRFTGLEILEAIALTRLPLPVILVTAFGDAALHGLARRLGAAAVFDKPFEVEHLVDAIERVVPGAQGASDRGSG